MTAPLHERLEAWAIHDRNKALGKGDGQSSRAADLTEAVAALRPHDGEIGALCERLGRGFEDAGEFTVVVDKDDLTAALAHLRRLAAADVIAERS